MNDSSEMAIKEADSWLVSAKDRLIQAQEDEDLSNVCCALAIHALIRASDALTLHFLGIKPTKHDDVSHIFRNLIQKGKLEADDGRFISLLEKAMLDKSGADYGKKRFTYEEASEYVQKAEEFVSAAKRYF